MSAYVLFTASSASIANLNESVLHLICFLISCPDLSLNILAYQNAWAQSFLAKLTSLVMANYFALM